MGRIFNTSTPTAPKTGGRIFGAPNVIDDYAGPKFPDGKPKLWEEMSFGEKAWETAKELPKTLYNFIPPSVREVGEERPKTGKEFAKFAGKTALAVPKGAVEFAMGIPEVTKQAVVGGVLQAKKALFGGKEEYTVPGFKKAGELATKAGAPFIGQQIEELGNLTSWGVQKKQLMDQGFSPEEATALVGINAYLGIMPLGVKALKTPTGRVFTKAVTTKEVPVSETPQAMRQAVIDEAKVKPTPATAEPIPSDPSSYKTAEEFVKANLKTDVTDFPNKSEWMKYNADVVGKGQGSSKVFQILTNAEKEWDIKIGADKVGNDVIKDIPIKSIQQNEYAGTLDGVVKELGGNVDARNKAFNGKEIPPIEVFADTDGKIHIVDGRNRLVRAIKEGKETIPAKVSGYYNLEKSQLISIWNEANKTQSNYLYHGTSETLLDSIAKDGLKPGRRGDLSLSKDESYARSFAESSRFPQKEGQGIMLRVKSDAVKTTPSVSGVASDKLNELLTKQTISPTNIEIFKNGKWQSLTSIWDKAQKGVLKEAEPKPIETTRIERPIITGTKKIFGATEEQQKFNDLLEQHLDKYFEGRDTILGKEDPLNKALIKLSDDELKVYSDLTQGLSEAKTASENLKNAVELWKKTNKEIEADLIKRKKLTAEQAENRRWKPVETTTGRTRAELQAMGVNPIYYPYLAEDLLKKSDFIATTGKRTKGGYLKRFTGKMLAEDSYIKDPKVAIPRNRVQVFRDKMNSELVDSIRDNFAERDKVVIKKYKSDPRFAEKMGVEEWKPSGSLRFFKTEEGVGVSKKVESYWIPKEVAKDLNRFYKPGTLEKTLRMTYDPLIDAWRVSVLNLAPRWVYNNTIGNAIMSILGKTDPLAFIKAGKEMFARTKLGQKLGITQKEIPKGVFNKEYAKGESARLGGLGGLTKEQTQFLRPLDNWMNLLEQAKKYKALRIPAIATQNLLKAWVAIGKPIGAMNRVVENFFRASMYISKTEGKFLGAQLDKPVPPAEGIRYVNEFLFDYSKLSRLERATFRRALPFYNWQKNITKFAFTFPAKHPIRALTVGALLQDYVDYINEVNQKEDKVKSVLRIKTDMVYDNKPVYINIKSAIPFGDVFKTIPRNFETFGRFLTSNPVSKIIVERAFRLNSFTGQPFTQPKEKQEFDEYGKPIAPLPSLPRHIGQQLPQTKLTQQISDTLQYGKPLKRYETGEPQISRGQIRTEDLLMDILGYFGVKLSPVEYNAIQRSVQKKGRLQDIKSKQYERRVETQLENLKARQ